MKGHESKQSRDHFDICHWQQLVAPLSLADLPQATKLTSSQLKKMRIATLLSALGILGSAPVAAVLRIEGQVQAGAAYERRHQ
jgi:hypothetical protein